MKETHWDFYLIKPDCKLVSNIYKKGIVYIRVPL